MLQLAVCEDQAHHLEYMVELLRAMPESSGFGIRPFLSAEALRAAWESGYRPNILITDIRLDDANGIDFVKCYIDGEPDIQVIYVSGYLEYCMPVYDTNHVYFLTKPLDTGHLYNAVRKALAALRDRDVGRIIIRDKTGVHLIPHDQIEFFESIGRKLKIQTAKDSFEIYDKLSTFTAVLPESFIHCHKSFLINVDHVASFEGAHFIMRSGGVVPVSQRRQKDVRNLFMDFLKMRDHRGEEFFCLK